MAGSLVCWDVLPSLSISDLHSPLCFSQTSRRGSSRSCCASYLGLLPFTSRLTLAPESSLLTVPAAVQTLPARLRPVTLPWYSTALLAKINAGLSLRTYPHISCLSASTKRQLRQGRGLLCLLWPRAWPHARHLAAVGTAHPF